MAFYDYNPDPANIVKGHMMDGLDAMGGDLSHIILRAVSIAAYPDMPQEIPLSETERQILRDFVARGTQHYQWYNQSGRKKIV